MAKLIALVCVTAFVDGVRAEFKPGEVLPDILPPHDVEALKRMKAVEDVDETVADEAFAKRKLERAEAEYQEARRRVQAAQASIAPAGGNTESNISGSLEPEGAAGGAIPGTNTSAALGAVEADVSGEGAASAAPAPADAPAAAVVDAQAVSPTGTDAAPKTRKAKAE